MSVFVTEETATHCAAGGIGEPLELRIRVYWIAGQEGARLVLSDLETAEEYGSWDVETADPLSLKEGGTPVEDSELDRLVGAHLDKWRIPGSGWTSDPVSLAAHFSLEWGWKWVPERLAR
ncbi:MULTISPECIES: hypothetical protein [Streptomyces]|uniref:Uncharacterized protein n=2 Tax=Streptomyces TaxID=1883 RepID=A0ABV9IT82_9ACTN